MELISAEQVKDGAPDLWALLDEIPINVNSDFQIENLVANHEMPGRCYRQIMLELFEKAKALKFAECERRRAEITIRKKEKEIAKLSKKRDKKEDIELLEVDIDEALFKMREQEKLVKDAMNEVQTYLKLLARLPKYDKAKFDAEEQAYWQKRLIKDAKRQMLQFGSVSEGTLQSLEKIGFNPAQVVAELRVGVGAEVETLAKKTQLQIEGEKA